MISFPLPPQLGESSLFLLKRDTCPTYLPLLLNVMPSPYRCCLCPPFCPKIDRHQQHRRSARFGIRMALSSITSQFSQHCLIHSPNGVIRELQRQSGQLLELTSIFAVMHCFFFESFTAT